MPVISKLRFIDKYKCIDDFKFPKGLKNWLKCPNCGLRPKVWVFDNGRHTACGCGKDKYNHFSIQAKSIMSYYYRNNNGTIDGYDSNELRDNWNHWVKTGKLRSINNGN